MLAIAVGCKEVEICSDVPGVYSSDPNLVPDAVMLPRLSHQQAIEMSVSGAKVLHQWCALGNFDFVNIVEAPDAATIAKVSVVLGARGSSKIESFELLEIDTLLEQLG